ncbi:MAG: hypothetical protein OXC72_14885 [Roseovarius sp.]|nr:hypothetical protein [Roseovarius sp.]
MRLRGRDCWHPRDIEQGERPACSGRYNPAAHHAKLAMNAAFALCEFLVKSRNYQAQRDSISTSAEVQEAWI